jgi:hypothetical protein
LTVRMAGPDMIELEGACPLEDAEILLQLLLEHQLAAVDWRKCQQAHTAVVQVLLASERALRGPAAGPFLTKYIEAALGSAGN